MYFKFFGAFLGLLGIRNFKNMQGCMSEPKEETLNSYGDFWKKDRKYERFMNEGMLQFSGSHGPSRNSFHARLVLRCNRVRA